MENDQNQANKLPSVPFALYLYREYRYLKAKQPVEAELAKFTLSQSLIQHDQKNPNFYENDPIDRIGFSTVACLQAAYYAGLKYAKNLEQYMKKMNIFNKAEYDSLVELQQEKLNIKYGVYENLSELVGVEEVAPKREREEDYSDESVPKIRRI